MVVDREAAFSNSARHYSDIPNSSNQFVLIDTEYGQYHHLEQNRKFGWMGNYQKEKVKRP